jgi:hypothetical protein
MKKDWAGRCTAVLAGLALGCETAQHAGETAAFRMNPVATTEVAVVERSAHGPYLFVHVRGRLVDRRFAVPQSELCASLLQPETSVRYEKSGNFGRFSREDEGCEAVGSLSPDSWRVRHTGRRAGVDSFAPRSTARYTVVHRDETYILLRGRFALASRVGIPSAFDLVAVVPVNEACGEVAARSAASLELRDAWSEPFRLLAGGAPCVIAGFAMPLGGASTGAAPAP